MTGQTLGGRVLQSDRFAETLRRVAISAVLLDLHAIDPDGDIPAVDWTYALRHASALTGDQSERAQDAALRIAQACICSRTAEGAHRQAAAVVLERMGNHLALGLAARRGLLEPDEWTRAPGPLQLDVIRKRLEFGIPVTGADTLPGNAFQREFWTEASRSQWLSVSAPTSAGKSFIVKRWFEEQIESVDHFRGVYVVPTRALIEEVSADLKDHFGDSVAVHTIPWDPEIGERPIELYVLTQERLHFLQQRFSDFSADLLFVDEAQKFADDSRGVLLQRVLDESVRRDPAAQVLFASPLAANPELLLEGAPDSAPASWLTSETITVNQNLLWVEQVRGNTKKWSVSLLLDGEPARIGHVDLPARPTRQTMRLALPAIAMGRDHAGNLVYVNGAADAETVAQQIHYHLPDNEKVAARVADLQELVRKTVHRQYVLAGVLDRGVAFHYGNMPLLVRTEIERLFREGVLKYLVCTSTLLEGVNLPCNNLFALGPKKGRRNFMTLADFWNLAGRAGRWGREFQGNVICLEARDVTRWPTPPTKRVRQPLSRATDSVLNNVATLKSYIEEGTPPERAQKDQLLESVFSFLAVRVGEGGDLAALPALRRVPEADRLELERLIRDVLERVELPHHVYTNHPGISPLSMQGLLEYFQEKPEQDELSLAPPEDSDAATSYVRAIARSSSMLGAPFGNSKRHFMLAILIRDWMRGRPLAYLISERIAYLRKRGDDNTPAAIRGTMSDVEEYARFQAPKYLGAYSDVLKHHLTVTGRGPEAEAMLDIPMMLELGVSRETELSLMTLGLSRTSAIAVAEFLPADAISRAECLAWLASRDVDDLDLPVLVRQEIKDAVRLAPRAANE